MILYNFDDDDDDVDNDDDGGGGGDGDDDDDDGGGGGGDDDDDDDDKSINFMKSRSYRFVHLENIHIKTVLEFGAIIFFFKI